jgi:hypothetical protein
MLHEIGDHYMIGAVCDPELVGFYSRLGFTSATVVSMRPYDHQARGADRADR